MRNEDERTPLFVVTLGAEARGRSPVATLLGRPAVNLLGVDGAADTIDHLDVQLGKNVR